MDQQERRRKAIKMLRDYKSNMAAIQTFHIDLQTLDALLINNNMAVTYDQPSGGQTDLRSGARRPRPTRWWRKYPAQNRNSQGSSGK